MVETVNPQIPLAARPTLPDFGTMIAGAQNLMQLQQQQQEQQRQNQLRQVLSQSEAFDQTGQLKPETLSKVMAIDPVSGLKLQENALVTQQRKLQLNALRTKASYDQATYLSDTYSPILAQYNENIAKGMSEPQARHIAQQATTEATEKLSQGGNLAPSAVSGLPRQFDPAKFERQAMLNENYRAWWKDDLARQREQDANRRAGTTSGTDTEGKPFILQPFGGPGGKPLATYIDGTVVPPDKLGGAHLGKGGATDSAAAKREKDAETLAAAKFREAHDGRDPDLNNPQEKAELAALTTAERQKATAMSGRNAIMVARGLTSAADAVSDIRNVAELPITIDTGIFGGRRQGPGLMAATKEILANEVTAEDAQAYNTAMAGLERSLGGLATGGLAVSDNVMRQFAKLQIVKGDTYFIKLRKLATMRQNVDNGLDGLLTNPQLGGEQAKLIQKLQQEVREAVPFTVHDVNQVEFGKDKTATVAQYAAKHGVGPAAPSGTAAPGAATPGTYPVPPQAAIDDLKRNRDNPVWLKSFEKHFGPAGKYLGTAQPTPAPAAAATPKAAPPPQRSDADQTLPPEGRVVPPDHVTPGGKLFSSFPDGQTFGGGKYVKRGDRMFMNDQSGDEQTSLQRARDAIKAGAPADAVKKKLRDAGIDPAKL